MMAEKAKLFNDENALNQILVTSHPGAAKAFGRQVVGFDESIWAANRFDIVVQGNLAKFRQNDELKSFLLATKDRVIVEASPQDRVWGVGR